MTIPSVHQAVMVDEVIDFLGAENGDDGVFVDCTLGGGGHSEGILKGGGKNRRVIAFDVDEDALAEVAQRLTRYQNQLTLIRRNFKELSSALEAEGVETVDGVLADLGVSSLQLDRAERGFSFQRDGPLDMRMDRRRSETAAHLVNRMTERELERLFSEYGGETFARGIAREIISCRRKRPFERTLELADLVARVKPRGRSKLHPATKVFQALRIVVNRELEGLEPWLADGMARLKKGGRFVVISFHSLEDRIVKHSFRDMERRCICPPRLPVCRCDKKQTARVVTKHPVFAGEAEKARNPRSRSARLRAAEKT